VLRIKKKTAEELAIKYIVENSQKDISLLSVIESSRTYEPLLEQQVSIVTIMSKDATNTIWKLVVCPKENVMDLSEYNKMLTAEYIKKYGKLSPDLAKLVKTSSDETKIKLLVWILDRSLHI
jgi:hypothetical protein